MNHIKISSANHNKFYRSLGHYVSAQLKPWKSNKSTWNIWYTVLDTDLAWLAMEQIFVTRNVATPKYKIGWTNPDTPWKQ